MAITFLSPLATAPRAELIHHQCARLGPLLRLLRDQNPFYRAKLAAAGVTVLGQLDSLAVMRDLPFTTKEELVEDQRAQPPFGSNLTFPLASYSRCHQTSGSTGEPLRWLDTPDSWAWLGHCWQQVLQAAGVTAADRLFFPASFGPFLGFWAAWEGATQLGALCLSGGGASSVQRVQQIWELGATGLITTPSYALHLANVAQQAGYDPADSPVRVLVVAGEPGGSQPNTRALLEIRWDAALFDHPGSTEAGAFAFACPYRAIHLNEAEFIAEVLVAESDEPTDEGELVLTNLGRHGSPVLRYRTGDYVRLRHDPCPCGCTFAWLDGGILGRVDEMLIVRGINLYPSAIENLVRAFPEVDEFLIELSRRGELDRIRLLVEVEEAAAERVTTALARAIVSQLMLTTPVVPVAPGSLPRWETKARRVRDLR